jgi:hypothetical protein
MADDADSDRYELWTLLPGVRGCADYKDLRHTWDGLEIRVIDRATRGVIRIRFERTYAFRSADEGDRYRTLMRMEKQRTLGETFQVVRNSSFLRWFGEETCHDYLLDRLVHYAIYTSDDCIDVLSDTPPTVEWTGEVEPPLTTR